MIALLGTTRGANGDLNHRQLSMSHGYLSSTAQSAAMGFHFPVEVSRDLVAAANDFTTEAMEIHGTGLVSRSTVNTWDEELTFNAVD